MMILLVTLALSGGVSMLVKTRFAAGQKVNISSGLTGADVAKAILMDAGITDVKVLVHHGFLSDHYNPLNKTLNLSKEVYYGRNASAAGVAAHEVGHAIQHAQGYFPLWLRSAIVPVANIGSNLGPWLVIIGIVLMGAGRALGYSLALAGVVLFAAAWTLWRRVGNTTRFPECSLLRASLTWPPRFLPFCSCSTGRTARGFSAGAGTRRPYGGKDVDYRMPDVQGRNRRGRRYGRSPLA